jgi:hypothetical protein
VKFEISRRSQHTTRRAWQAPCYGAERTNKNQAGQPANGWELEIENLAALREFVEAEGPIQIGVDKGEIWLEIADCPEEEEGQGYANGV